MIDEIRQFLRTEGLHDNIAIATLLDALYEADEECLAEDIENTLSRLKLTSSSRVGTLQFALEDEDTEPDEEGDD